MKMRVYCDVCGGLDVVRYWYRESAQESDAGALGTPDCCFEHAEQTLMIALRPPQKEP